MADFSDQKYIEIIRKALWTGTQYGRAAVMIGSGFSQNAERQLPSSRPFPLWMDMGKMFVEELYSGEKHTESERLRLIAEAASTSGALRLAEEFEAAFGRPKLNEMLQEAIPDAGHLPGTAHKLLLELPWADVLTTNYDTLLERGADKVVGRKYGVVRTIEDIPIAMRPRIVKLHGSFPAHRPFIITEEDFRTYPTRFASFVNLAQQSIMENIVCLLGFSGDDPNFLYWTGWVRDNLGESAPRIYLCGILDITDSKRRLLYRRNVTPIDLGSLFPRSDFPDPSARHRIATEWLLRSLKIGKPPEPMAWPMEDKMEDEGDTPWPPELPPLLEPIHGKPLPESMLP